MIDKKQNYVMRAEPAIAVITPHGMAKTAVDFFKMAEEYKSDATISLARYYLFCASIELGLKAAILATDCTTHKKKHIQKLGHDLLAVYNDFAENYAAIWDSSDVVAVTAINPFFKKKGLEYFTIDVLSAALNGFKEVPKIDEVGLAARKVNGFLQANKQFIDGKTTEKPQGGWLSFV